MMVDVAVAAAAATVPADVFVVVSSPTAALDCVSFAVAAVMERLYLYFLPLMILLGKTNADELKLWTTTVRSKRSLDVAMGGGYLRVRRSLNGRSDR